MRRIDETARPVRRPVRRHPSLDQDYIHLAETEPDIPDRPGFGELIEELAEYVARRHADGDPCRWRCLMERFGAPYGRDRHTVISYAIDRLQLMRRVRVLDRIPELIVPQAPPSGRTSGEPDFKFGRIKGDK